jgi:hypothetical protein
MQFAGFAKRISLAVSFLGVLCLPVAAQSSRPAAVISAKPETVEWVYRVRYGSEDEWWQIFRKYQLAILQHQKQLGYVLDYTVWAPGLHTSESHAGTTASSSSGLRMTHRPDSLRVR